MYIISIHIYIYIILFLAYYYTPYGDIHDIILMGYLSILFCFAQEMENELDVRTLRCRMWRWQMADGLDVAMDMATAKDPTSIYLYIYIYIYMHMQWSIIRQCWLAYCSTCSVFVRTIFVAIFMNVYQQFGVGLGCRCCRNEWLFSVCTSRLRIEFPSKFEFRLTTDSDWHLLCYSLVFPWRPKGRDVRMLWGANMWGSTSFG